ncbi:hypothetical protein ACFPRA_19030 [Sporosarcina soli]|uniref:Stage III sporulation protein AG n=1 Tax=Sporosarcina soli TaxID=334736 RepID=A0ABW0TQ79_9BACL
MTGHSTGSLNGNGDEMQKPTKKIQMILLGTITVMVIIFINSSLGGIGGEKGEKEENGEFVALEEALMEIEGIGDVTLYFHYENGNAGNPLSDYFSMSTTSPKKGNELQGVLVIAEGAENLEIKSKLLRILSTVLQLPEHRIVVEMKKRGSTNENE